MSEVTNTKELKESFERIIKSLENANKDRIDGAIEPKVISCDYETKSAMLSFRIYDWMYNFRDTMHGGFVTVLMDSAFGWFGSALLGGQGVSATSVNVSFIDPILPDDHVIIEAKLNAVKSRIVFAEGNIRRACEPDKILAYGNAQLYRLKNQ